MSSTNGVTTDSTDRDNATPAEVVPSPDGGETDVSADTVGSRLLEPVLRAVAVPDDAEPPLGQRAGRGVADGKTSAQGTFATRGFLGDYEIEVKAGGKSKTEHVSLTKTGAKVECVLE